MLRRSSTRTFHRWLLGGIQQSVILLKRNDDQQEGTVTAYTLYQCVRSKIVKSGQPIQGDMATNHRTIWYLPQCELDRVGVNYINVLDRIIDSKNRYWQPESGDTIEAALFENYWVLACQRVDPPSQAPSNNLQR